MPFLTVCLSFLFSFASAAAAARPHSLREAVGILRAGEFYRRAGLNFLFTLLAVMLVAVDFAAPLRLSLSVFAISAAASFLFAALSLAWRLHGAEERDSRRVPIAAAALLLLALFAELFVCNFHTWQSMDYTPTDLTDRVTLTNVATDTPDENGFYETLHPKKAVYIHCGDPQLPLKNLYVVLEAEYAGESVKYLTLTPTVADEGNAIPYTVAGKVIAASPHISNYLFFNLAGDCRSLRLSADAEIDRIAVRCIVANTPRPLAFSGERFAWILAILLLAYALRPTSPLYRFKLADFRRPARVATFGVILLFCTFMFSVIALRGGFLKLMAPWQAQYQHLADAFLNGHLHLFRETPPDFLLSMDNPYDTGLRGSLESEYGQQIYWDAAFYNGNYYVYFGVLPCLLLYLPYRAITGGDLPNDIAVFIFACLVTVAVFMLVYELLRRFADTERIPLLTYFLFCILLLTGGGLISACATPDMYSVPILAGLGFALLGLALWLRSLRGEKLRRLPLFFGSLCMAATAACRPQLLLLAFLAFPLFWQSIRKKDLFSRKSLLDTSLALLPFVLVAAPLMWYNAARFGSPFDFGANYNLTTNDMTLRGFRVERLALGVWHYLLQLPRFITVFPFLRPCDLDTVFRGVTVCEAVYGGLFAVCPFALFSLGIFKRREQMKANGSFPLTLGLLGIGILIPLFDALAAGILQRYFLDFAILLLLAALLVFIHKISEASAQGQLALRRLFLLCFAASSLYRLLLFWTESGAPSHLIQFWN